MAQQPPRDHADRIARLEDRVRQLELRVRGKGGNKVFIVPGPITLGMSIPPIDMAVGAPDETIPETREIVGVRGKVQAGTVESRWSLNGAPITGTDAIYGTTWHTVLLDTPVPVVDADELLLEIVSATSDAAALTGTVLLASRID